MEVEISLFRVHEVDKAINTKATSAVAKSSTINLQSEYDKIK